MRINHKGEADGRQNGGVAKTAPKDHTTLGRGDNDVSTD